MPGAYGLVARIASLYRGVAAMTLDLDINGLIRRTSQAYNLLRKPVDRGGAQFVRAFISHAVGLGVRNPIHDRPNSLNQIVTAPLPNARQEV